MRNPQLEEILAFLRYASVFPYKGTGLEIKLEAEDKLKEIAEQNPKLDRALLEANSGPTRPTRESGKFLTNQSPKI